MPGLQDEAAVGVGIDVALGNIDGVNALGSVGGGAVTVPDPDVDAVTTVTLTANTTFTFPTPQGGKKFHLVITQDGTGSRTGTFTSPSGSVLWPGGHASNALSTAANSVDLVDVECLDGVNWVAKLSKALAV